MISGTFNATEDELLNNFQSLIVKKKESQIIQFLEKMFSYTVDMDKWCQLLLEALLIDKKKVLRYVSYFLSIRHGIPQTPLSPQNAQLLRVRTTFDLQSTNPFKSLAALRMLGSSTKFNQKECLFYDALLYILGNKNTEKFSFKITPYLTSEALFQLRYKYNNLDPSWIELIVPFINSSEVSIARHALAVLRQLLDRKNLLNSNSNKSLVFLTFDNLLSPLLSPSNVVLKKKTDFTSTPGATFNNSHESIRSSWVALCSELAIRCPNSRAFQAEITGFLSDVSNQVFFAAVRGLVKLGWNFIQHGVSTVIGTPYSEHGTSGGMSNLSVIIHRLINGLTDNSIPIVYATCKNIRVLARGHAINFDMIEPEDLGSRPNLIPINQSNLGGPRTLLELDSRTESNIRANDEHPLKELKKALNMVLALQKSPYIHVKAIQALIWIEHPWDGNILADLIERESGILKTPLLDLVINEYLKRVKFFPSLAESLLNLYYRCYVTQPEKISIYLLKKIWSVIMTQGETGSALTLNNICSFLELTHQKNSKLVAQKIRNFIYWVLGEKACTLTREVCGAMPDVSSLDFDIPIFPLTNKTLQSFLHKLEFVATASPMESRVISVEALIKIALQASYTTRLQIYDFLTNICQLEGSYLYPYIVPIFNILDQIFHIRSLWSGPWAYGKKMGKSEIRELKESLVKLKPIFKAYVPSLTQNPIGPDVERFLDEYKKKKNLKNTL